MNTNYQNKNILVLGLGKSGYQAAKLLNTLGAEVTVNDAEDLTENEDAKELEERGVAIISGNHPVEMMKEIAFDLMVKNPGIPYSNPMIEEALNQSIPVITEVEMGAQLMEAEIIGVTGTNGKTTTTSMIKAMLETNRTTGKAYAIGNIGVPASQMALEVEKVDDVIMELSSFQLMGTPTLKPNIAVITNIYSAHLDYHGSQTAYEEAKLNITRNQTAEDVLIYNKDQTHLEELVLANSQATLLPFSRTNYLEEGVSVKEGLIYFKGEKVAHVSDIFLAGQHNLENFLAAIAVAKLKNISNEVIQSVLSTFTGVKHRTQYVATFNERIFYNDSKATNIEATENALNGFKQPVILLAGGLDRGNTFDALVPALEKNVKALVTFGETAQLMEDAAHKAGISVIKKAENVEQAVPVAYEISAPGDVILLSPAAASWDQYESFEVRGDRYIEAVQTLMNDSSYSQ
jgi:UDP-N-acetylmuramoylalanine--D-glutamate ligase